MARQVGLIKLEGSLGDLSFYKSGDAYLVRQKAGPRREQVAKDPRFRRTRENSMEFGRAVRTAKVFRDELRRWLEFSADRKFALRLNARMLRLLKADHERPRGERKVCATHLTQLLGMDCNVNARLAEVLFLKERPQFDRSSGEASFAVPALRVKDIVRQVADATHVRMLLVALAFDPEGAQNNRMRSVQSAYLDVTKDSHSVADRLVIALEAGAQTAVILLLGLHYFQLANEAYYPLQNGQYNMLSIVEVDTPT